MSEHFRTPWLSVVVDIIKRDSTNRIIVGNKEFAQVVRCKDCKYRMTEVSNDEKTMCYCPFVDRYTVDDWYCADGERRDDENN